MNSYTHSTSRNSMGSSDRTAVVSVKAQNLGLGLSFRSLSSFEACVLSSGFFSRVHR